MKIMGIAAEQFGSGMKVTISYFVAANEELEDTDAQRILDLAREVTGTDHADGSAGGDVPDVADKQVSRDTKVAEPVTVPGRQRRGSAAADPVAASVTEEKVARTNAEHEGGRRRRGSADPTQSETAENAAASPVDVSSAPTTRQRRGAVAAAEQPSSEPVTTANTASPSNGGSRQRRSVPTSTPSTAASPDATTRRSRSDGAAPASATKSDGAAPTKITDEDLLKAASETTRKCGGDTEIVKGIMKKFAVGQLGKLDPEDRQDFLDALKDARAKA